MSLSTHFKPQVRIGIVHAIVFVIFLFIILIQFPLRSQDTPTGKEYHWGDLGTTLLSIAGFYLHALVLIPILLRKKNLQKYLLHVILCLILFGIIITWFQAVSPSLITRYDDGTRPEPIDLFFGFLSQGRSLLALIIPFIPFSAISFIYYLLIINKEYRKELFSSKYTEPIFNIVVVSSIYLFSILNTIESLRMQLFIIIILSTLIFYCNTFYLVPLLLKKKKISKYIIFNLLLFIVFYLSILEIAEMGKNYAAINVGRRYLTYSYDNGLFAIGFWYVLLIITSFIYGYTSKKLKAKEQLFNLKLGTKDSELKLLKSQVNPHFLFNTLNTLYATALEENASKTAESTAKLASLIRYMQEDINKDFIPLENEIKYLGDYITIQKLRCAIVPQIETEFKHIENHRISPSLFIPFVENAFKYGIDPSKPSKLKVSVICDENTINFECVNSFNTDFKTYYKEQGFGIGIKNAKQRLQLVYPKKHTFEVVNEDGVFSVNIRINTK